MVDSCCGDLSIKPNQIYLQNRVNSFGIYYTGQRQQSQKQKGFLMQILYPVLYSFVTLCGAAYTNRLLVQYQSYYYTVMFALNVSLPHSLLLLIMSVCFNTCYKNCHTVPKCQDMIIYRNSYLSLTFNDISFISSPTHQGLMQHSEPTLTNS